MTPTTAPLVSVTSAFYNTGPALLDMVRSVLAQTFDDFELVMLDDGSTDESLELARSVADPRVRVYTNDQNRGRSFSLNRLTELSRGRYIARMDSDDMSATTRIAKQVALLKARADVDVVSCGITFIDAQRRPLGVRCLPTDHAAIVADPYRHIGICHGAILARREWFERFRYDESVPIAVDSQLLLRAYRDTRFANLDEPLYYYRYTPSFTLRKQWITRCVVGRYQLAQCVAEGRTLAGVARWTVQHAKFLATAAAFGLGWRRRLLARRFTPWSVAQRAAYDEDLARIMSVSIDGAPKTSGTTS